MPLEIFRRFTKHSASSSAIQSASSSTDNFTTSRPEPPARESGTSSPCEPGYQKRLTTTGIDHISKYRVVAKYLHKQLTLNQWLSASEGSTSLTGVLIRAGRNNYISEPEEISPVLHAAVQSMNVPVAFTMLTETTRTIIESLQPGQREVLLPNRQQIQVIPSLASIVKDTANGVKKFQYAALIHQEGVLLVWHDQFESILVQAAAVDEKLLALMYRRPTSLLSSRNSFLTGRTVIRTAAQSMLSLPMAASVRNTDELKSDVGNITSNAIATSDPESGKLIDSLDRPLALTSSIYVGLGMCLLIILELGLGVSSVIYEILTDGNYVHAALFVTLPIIMVVSLFFAMVIFGNLFQVLGPTKTLKTNTRYFSTQPPDLAAAYAEGFRPRHITIQMPVYTESLNDTILPTIKSLKTAISYYESHGGSATIFVNDDGFAYMTPEQQQVRANFYHDNNIGWVARPRNNSECGYVRKGKFKKASNMNFALNVANKVEDELLEMLSPSLEKSEFIDPVEEETCYQLALLHVLETDSRVKAGGNIRLGEHILLVDSDTRVPVDCLLQGAAEMFLSPEVAIVQHSTGVMQVSWDYFENGITFFTNLVYTAIRISVGSGEVAPFVGHNAFLRWQAVQAVGFPDDGYTAYWSESHVSEDFDLALRLQIAGNLIRLASYHGDEFKEGVSLTIYDELMRWQKYAYGCNELVFNPIHTWLWKSPFTPLFRSFLGSSLQLSSKITILGYVTSYYAMASGFPLTVLNYFLVGWFNGYLDKYYMESWKILLSIYVVFILFGNFSLAIIRSRLAEKGFLAALLENFKWAPMMLVFFGGLSFHLSLAILAHMFSINMQWSATSKEKSNSNFFREVPKIFKTFKWMYAVMVPFIGGMIYLGCFAPKGWEITLVTAVVPMAIAVSMHIMVPILLNPSLMVFNY